MAYNERRTKAYIDCVWWPSSTHFAVLLLLGQASYYGVDPDAPRPGSIRARLTQMDISEQLNMNPRTVRRVFRDFERMGLMYSAAMGRRWYVSVRLDDPVKAEETMQDRWRAIYPKKVAADDERNKQADEPVVELQWWEGDDEPETAPSTNGSGPSAARSSATVGPDGWPLTGPYSGLSDEMMPRDYPVTLEDWREMMKWIVTYTIKSEGWERLRLAKGWTRYEDAMRDYQAWYRAGNAIVSDGVPGNTNGERWMQEVNSSIRT